MRAAASCVFLVAFGLALWAEERPNLLKNPDFEEVKSDGLLDGWRQWGRKTEPEIRHEVSTDAHFGQRCAHLIAKGKGYHGGVSQFMDLKAGCRYRFSAWIKIKMHGEGRVRCCYQETRRVVGGKRSYPNSMAADMRQGCDWTHMENVFDALPDKDSSYGIHAVLAHGDVEVWLDDACLVECGPVLGVDNGKMVLDFGDGLDIVRIRMGGKHVASLRCAIAQFEKEGIGYKGTGIGSPGPAVAKAFEVKERTASECVVDVTCEWPHSEATKRRFEAVYRITVLAGRPWFESRLVSIRNTDTVDYDGVGYYHMLQPVGRGNAVPKCFPACAAWVRGQQLIGAAVESEDDFQLGLRRGTDGEPHGDITRKAKMRLPAGKNWQEQEPSVFVFVSDDPSAQEIVRMREEILSRPAPDGALKYEERKDAAKEEEKK